MNTREVQVAPGIIVIVKEGVTDEQARQKAIEKGILPKEVDTPEISEPTLNEKKAQETPDSFKKDAVKVLTSLATQTTRTSQSVARTAAETLGFDYLKDYQMKHLI